MKRLILLGIGCFLTAAQGWAQDLSTDNLSKVEARPITDNGSELMCIQIAKPYILCEECKGLIKKEKEKCTDLQLVKFIYAQLVYPQTAKDSLIEGKVYVSFDIELNGNMCNIKVVKDIGGGCGEEALRVTRLLAKTYKWRPAIIEGKEEQFTYRFPIQFKLKKQ